MAASDAGTLAPDELRVEHLGLELGAWPGAVGRVLEVGAELVPERERWLGRLVALPSLRSCGACLPCRRGHAGACPRRAAPPSPMAQGRIAARLAVAFDDTLAAPDPPALAAALAGTGLHAYGAVVRAGVEPNRAALVLGRGALARFVAALVAHRGATPIRCDALTDAPRVEAALAEQGVEPFGVPVIAAVDDAGAACALAGPGATVVLCVPCRSAASVPQLVSERGLSLVAHTGAHPDLLPELCAFVASGQLDLAPLCHLTRSPEAIPGEPEQAIVWAIG